MNKSVLLATALVLAGLSSSAAAAEGWFVRGEAGNTKLDIDGAEGDDDSYGVRGGYFFTPNVAVEGFYTNYGEDSGDGVSAKLSGFGVGVVGKKNFGPDAHTGFFISGRAGVVRVDTKLRVAEVGTAKDNSTKGYLGVGAGYDFTNNFGVSLNYDYAQADVFDVDAKLKTATVGIEYRF
ncbi:MAG: outer membrane beta-barrel protein [Pseudoxanthomonas sp.]